MLSGIESNIPSLGDIAVWLMRDKRYTTKSLAAAIGVSQPAVSRLATGKTASLRFEPAVRLIRLAGWTVRMPEDGKTAADASNDMGAARAA